MREGNLFASVCLQQDCTHLPPLWAFNPLWPGIPSWSFLSDCFFFIRKILRVRLFRAASVLNSLYFSHFWIFSSDSNAVTKDTQATKQDRLQPMLELTGWCLPPGNASSGCASWSGRFVMGVQLERNRAECRKHSETWQDWQILTGMLLTILCLVVVSPSAAPAPAPTPARKQQQQTWIPALQSDSSVKLSMKIDSRARFF